MEPTITPEPLPFPDRRNSARRSEDVSRIQHIKAVRVLAPGLAKEIMEAMSQVRGYVNALPIQRDYEVPFTRLDRLLSRASNHIRTLYRLGDPSHCHMYLMIEKAVGFYCGTAENQGVSFSIQCYGLETLPVVRGYEWLFDDIFFEVVKRAFRVTQPDGTVTISAEIDQAQGAVILVVHDTGPSIAPRFCDVLNSGQELDERETVATGADNALHLFGLQRARIALEIHGGRLSIDRGEGAGTSCSLSFPIA